MRFVDKKNTIISRRLLKYLILLIYVSSIKKNITILYIEKN